MYLLYSCLCLLGGLCAPITVEFLYPFSLLRIFLELDISFTLTQVIYEHLLIIEGITATSLLVAGGPQALSALQAMSIATGFVYTILICISCLSLWRALKVC